MYKPTAIRAGDTIGIVAPASSITPEQIKFGIQMLERRGYRLLFAKHLFKKNGHLAGLDEERAADLLEMWFNPDVDAVLCARGGYGCARLLPYLDLDAMAKAPKLLIGFSDITTLHIALNQRGLVTLYAPMLVSFSSEKPKWVSEVFFDAIEGRIVKTPKEASHPETITPGVAEGMVTGGCLCLVCDSLGTKESINAKDCILILEDVDEPPHRVDAMLTHLLNSGQLQSTAGIVIGEMTRSDDRIDQGIGGLPWKKIVAERIASLGIPSIMGFPFGHQNQMMSIPLGIPAKLDATNGTFEFLESGVSN